MKYNLLFSNRALKQLKKLDKNISAMILKKIKIELLETENPRATGKALVGDKKGLWRYRYGNYRVICSINDDKLIILALEVGHRKEIYK